MAPLIEIVGLNKTFRMGEIEVPALCGVNLSIERGEFVAIMGASGSGKSTLMNILGCLDRPTSGRYLLESVDTASLKEEELAAIRSRRIGFIFQTFNLLSRTTALENVELPLFYSQWNQEGEERARQLLAKVGLQGREQNNPKVAPPSGWRSGVRGTPPGSETIGSLSAASPSAGRAQGEYTIMRRNKIMSSEVRVADSLGRDDVLFIKTPPVEFCAPVSRDPAPGRRLMRGGVERILQLATFCVALALTVGVWACSKSLFVSGQPSSKALVSPLEEMRPDFPRAPSPAPTPSQ